MAQEQLSGWIETAVSTLGGAALAFVGLVWRVGRRDKEIDENITAKAHELRLYVDAQDKQNRHDMYNFMQRELIVKFEASLEKLAEKVEYHEGHDDKRFSELVDRINNGFKDLSDRIADLRVQVAIREAARVRDLRPPSEVP